MLKGLLALSPQFLFPPLPPAGGGGTRLRGSTLLSPTTPGYPNSPARGRDPYLLLYFHKGKNQGSVHSSLHRGGLSSSHLPPSPVSLKPHQVRQIHCLPCSSLSPEGALYTGFAQSRHSWDHKPAPAADQLLESTNKPVRSIHVKTSPCEPAFSMQSPSIPDRPVGVISSHHTLTTRPGHVSLHDNSHPLFGALTFMTRF